MSLHPYTGEAAARLVAEHHLVAVGFVRAPTLTRPKIAKGWANVGVDRIVGKNARRLCYKDMMVESHREASMIPQPNSLVGTWRRFGPVSPVYEIIAAGDALPDGDRVMRVRVVETGEEVDYRFSEILDDPRER